MQAADEEDYVGEHQEGVRRGIFLCPLRRLTDSAMQL